MNNQLVTNEMGLGIKARREEFLSEFISLNSGWIEAKAYGYLGNSEDAEEAANSVYLKIWDKIDQWDPSVGTFKAWSNTVIHNYLRDQNRRKHRKKQVHVSLLREDQMFVYENLSTGNTPLSDVVKVEESEILIVLIEDALECVQSRKKRICWILNKLEGYSCPEVARILGLSMSCVKNNVWRCSRELEAIIKRKAINMQNAEYIV